MTDGSNTYLDKCQETLKKKIGGGNDVTSTSSDDNHSAEPQRYQHPKAESKDAKLLNWIESLDERTKPTSKMQYSDLFINDKVLRSTKQPDCLMSCMQTVVENSGGKRAFRIIEYGAGHIYQHILPWFRCQPNLEVEYLVVGKMSKASILTEYANDVSLVEWNFKEPIPDTSGDADVVILNMPSFLAESSELVKGILSYIYEAYCALLITK